MTQPPRYNLSDADKDALLSQQAEMIERLVRRVGELEALVGKPRKTSKNSSIPPAHSTDRGRLFHGMVGAGSTPSWAVRKLTDGGYGFRG